MRTPRASAPRSLFAPLRPVQTAQLGRLLKISDQGASSVSLPQNNIAEVLVAKHRHGATGQASLYFRKDLTQFRDLDTQRTELDY